MVIKLQISEVDKSILGSKIMKYNENYEIIL